MDWAETEGNFRQIIEKKYVVVQKGKPGPKARATGGRAMKYSDIEDAFLFVSSSPPFEHYAYINKETGESYYVSEMAGMDETPEDIEDNDEYVSVPHKNDLDLGRDLVFDFIASVLPDELQRVRQIFRKAGAYSRFKDLLESKGQLDAWYEFERKATENALRKWCGENGVSLDG